MNNAGITRDNLLMRMKTEEWDAVFSTNLSSIYRVCKACLRGMAKARYGRIVNIGSDGRAQRQSRARRTTRPRRPASSASRRRWPREIASRNITVNVVAPGFIDTDMTRALDEKQVQALREQIPLARLGSVADIAAAVVFLVSDAGSYITGETLNVNGGMLMH